MSCPIHHQRVLPLLPSLAPYLTNSRHPQPLPPSLTFIIINRYPITIAITITNHFHQSLPPLLSLPLPSITTITATAITINHCRCHHCHHYYHCNVINHYHYHQSLLSLSLSLPSITVIAINHCHRHQSLSLPSLPSPVRSMTAE